jgi:hypothetical protein
VCTIVRYKVIWASQRRRLYPSDESPSTSPAPSADAPSSSAQQQSDITNSRTFSERVHEAWRFPDRELSPQPPDEWVEPVYTPTCSSNGTRCGRCMGRFLHMPTHPCTHAPMHPCTHAPVRSHAVSAKSCGMRFSDGFDPFIYRALAPFSVGIRDLCTEVAVEGELPRAHPPATLARRLVRLRIRPRIPLGPRRGDESGLSISCVVICGA